MAAVAQHRRSLITYCFPCVVHLLHPIPLAMDDVCDADCHVLLSPMLEMPQQALVDATAIAVLFRLALGRSFAVDDAGENPPARVRVPSDRPCLYSTASSP